MPRWALPDFVEDILPPEGLRVEHARRTLIDTSVARGYGFVQPPLVEYVDALSAGTDELDDHMFKVVDQLSGRLLGVRADMTPQAARIDAHLFADRPINRLCYAGSVLHTHPTALNATREVIQGGAELYGVAGREGDEEVLTLLLAICEALQLNDLYVDLGHAAVFRALCDAAQLTPIQRAGAREALQKKDVGAVKAITGHAGLALLPTLYGESAEVIANAKKILQTAPQVLGVLGVLNDLEHIAAMVKGRGARVTLDLADVPNYDYHNGLVFSVYVAGERIALARGGRYDNIGVAYGAALPRAATGFSMDLRLAAAYSP
jgi:ATP phosphoribosyltransferase regulatory subunit